jgi:hypothetical protein
MNPAAPSVVIAPGKDSTSTTDRVRTTVSRSTEKRGSLIITVFAPKPNGEVLATRIRSMRPLSRREIPETVPTLVAIGREDAGP